SEAKGNPQMKLQGSDTQSIKTLQSENAPQPKSRFPISGLAFLHGRLAKLIVDRKIEACRLTEGRWLLDR
ncbi:MAG TPA: hypothetical protein VMT72_02170, partial [Pseudolabrys sp.]|nr:hypothetical protein [Pseudolabrys sp.]